MNRRESGRRNTSFAQRFGGQLRDLTVAPVSRVCSGLLWLLHNRNTPSFSREELRELQLGFAQFGEDHAVIRLAREQGLKRGHYVDAGAYHPISLSNTLLLHKMGWSGMNIDLNPQTIELFNLARPGDTNVIGALSGDVRTATVLHNQFPVLNRLAPADPSQVPGFFGEPSAISTVTTTTLTRLLDMHPPKSGRVDYLNVDCEGHDLMVLRGFDWARWRPAVVTVEAIENAERDALINYMTQQAYVLRDVLSFTYCFVPLKPGRP
jgi:Methyltransferase FkbM domain